IAGQEENGNKAVNQPGAQPTAKRKGVVFALTAVQDDEMAGDEVRIAAVQTVRGNCMPGMLKKRADIRNRIRVSSAKQNARTSCLHEPAPYRMDTIRGAAAGAKPIFAWTK